MFYVHQDHPKNIGPVPKDNIQNYEIPKDHIQGTKEQKYKSIKV